MTEPEPCPRCDGLWAEMSELPPPTAPSLPNPGVAENGRRAAGGGVRHTEPAAVHKCPLPEHGGSTRDLWRCRYCGRLWVVTGGCRSGCTPGEPCFLGLAWGPATLWQRWRNRRRP